MKSEWISMKDRLPPCCQNILLYSSKIIEKDKRDDGNIFVGYWLGEVYKSWECVWGDGWVPFRWEDITHWMPLPKPPEENAHRN